MKKNKDKIEMITVICPVFNEEKYIKTCLESIINQDISSMENLEILFIDGISNDSTVSIIKEYSNRYPNIKILENPYKTVPYALNIGIRQAEGNIILRIDAHSYYPTNYISTLVRYLKILNADNIGSIAITDIINKNKKTLAIKEVLTNRFGVGNSIFRIGIKKITSVDTVPYGCWWKKTFEKYGLFDVRLERNQDIEFNKRILRAGGRIFIVPDTYFIYYARETFHELAKNNYQNGKWNILTVKYTKKINSLSIRHFVPLIFIVSIIIPIILGFFNTKYIYLFFVNISVYLLFIIYNSFVIGIKKRLNVYYLFMSFIVLHFSYGFGSLAGLINCIFCSKKY
jgi:glycosyltransferase involved in cell wall biosynthesis